MESYIYTFLLLWKVLGEMMQPFGDTAWNASSTLYLLNSWTIYVTNAMKKRFWVQNLPIYYIHMMYAVMFYHCGNFHEKLCNMFDDSGQNASPTS